MAAELAQTHGRAALVRGDAVLVGNRAGVVEWASAAFSQLTGFPLGETLDKPITHFLDRAGLEVELVEFVAQHFLEGHACTVELPFETFDQRSIHVHLEVEPLRQNGGPEDGEITRFLAVARDVSGRVLEDSALPLHETDHRAPLPFAEPLQSSPEIGAIPLADLLSRAGRRIATHVRSEIFFEVLVEPDLETIVPDPSALAALLDCLLEAALGDADGGPIFVTALAGVLAPGRSHISRVHPVPARSIPHAFDERIYLEIHDTRPHLARDVWTRIQAGEPGRNPRERALARAAEKAERLGLTLHLDSTPGCGTQALLLAPARSLEDFT